MPAQITVHLQGALIQTLPLEGPSLTIGRLPDTGLTLPHPLVSRHHATLHLEGGQLVLTDAGSTNGTFVGEERLLPDQPRVLAPGESFRIGPFVVTYEAAEPEERVDEPEVTPVGIEETALITPEQLAAATAEPPSGATPAAEPAAPPPAAHSPDGPPERPDEGPPAAPLPEEAAQPPAPDGAPEPDGAVPEPGGAASEPDAQPPEPDGAARGTGEPARGTGEPAPEAAAPPEAGAAPLPPLPATQPPAPVPPNGRDGSAEPNGHVPAPLAAALGQPAEPIALIGRLPALTGLTTLAPARPTTPAPLPRGPVSAYLDDLPAIYQDGDFLGRFLLIFESIWEPLEQRQDHLALYFDPRTCPAGFLPWLGSWLEFSVNPHWPEARLRRLLSEAMDLYRWRGTRYGLTRLIELCTGLTPVVTEPQETPFVFHVALHLPPDSAVSRELIEQLVQAHKPAHAGYVLDISA